MIKWGQMKKDLTVIAILSLATLIVYRLSFFNFFAQDDFILINQFSQNNLFVDIQKSLGRPEVTHWRPFHNLYFLISGNLFGTNYIFYHLLTFIILILTGFFLYKTTFLFSKEKSLSLLSSLLYVAHPAHFVSLFWISGGATVIGSFFLIASFYNLLNQRRKISLILYICALLASEAMIVGLPILIAYEIVEKEKNLINATYKNLVPICLSFLFLFVRFFLFTSKTTFDTYKLELNLKSLSAVKYYILRTVGLEESSTLIIKILLLIWLVPLVIILAKKLLEKGFEKKFLFFSFVTLTGSFPFVLIPNHLSPHYMNISIIGFAALISLAFQNLKAWQTTIFVIFFIILSFFQVNTTFKNNWVTKRSRIAKSYLSYINKESPKSNSTLIFPDSNISSSFEAYVSLGSGDAIKFFYPKEKYKTCFTAFEACLQNPNSYVIPK